MRGFAPPTEPFRLRRHRVYFGSPAQRSLIHGFQRRQVAFALLTYIASTQATGAALAVAVLGLGTLSLLTVVILNRRIALNQINDSLVQISKQLRELQTERGSP